jgi:hypothetical protein
LRTSNKDSSSLRSSLKWRKVRTLNLWRLGTLSLVAAFLLIPSLALAVPTAKWLNPWVVNPLAITLSQGLGADASANRFFGPLGAAGETLSGTSAAAFSRALADSGTFGSASASTGVLFSRTFQLSGSPDGWQVTLSGRLVGELVAAFDTNPSANVRASATITGGPTLNWGTITVMPNRVREVDIPMAQMTMKSDGTYTVQGELTTFTSIQASGLFGTNGRTSAEFTASGRGLFVGVDASPIPEPATIVLLGSGLAGLVAARARRRSM